jgi:catechol 2,3-dioxygenase-like lactoylglutathione lyase family enzyme
VGRKKVISFNDVNHLAMATADMDKTVHFWRNLLSMRLVAGLGHWGGEQYAICESLLH